jgi:hypothetical protein
MDQKESPEEKEVLFGARKRARKEVYDPLSCPKGWARKGGSSFARAPLRGARARGIEKGSFAPFFSPRVKITWDRKRGLKRGRPLFGPQRFPPSGSSPFSAPFQARPKDSSGWASPPPSGFAPFSCPSGFKY